MTTEIDFNRWRRQFQSGEQAAVSAHHKLLEKDETIRDLQWSLNRALEKVDASRRS